MTIASTDTGVLLPKSEAALVTANGGRELQLLLPEYGDKDVPELVLYLAVCLARADDQDFFNEMMDWLKSEAIC